MSLSRFVGICSLGLLVLVTGAVCGQHYSNKPVRFVNS